VVLIYSPRCLEYAAPGHPENPSRVSRAATLLHKGHYVWRTPTPCTEADLLRVHTATLIEAVRTGNDYDADTPHFPAMDELARLAAGAAILAGEQARQGQPAFSLMRPPGHHAERNRSMGFCYFNNIAVAVARLLEQPAVQRVAILDFDCHHGNGTEDIFRGQDRVLFVSLHQAPCYPGTGLASAGNIVNLPLPPGTPPPEFLAALDLALANIQAWRPDVLAVSAGFDAFKEDPLTEMGLEIETYHAIGARIRATKLPVFAVLEGGYARQLAECVEAFVSAW
jgi:acetoin utilization deacetylase AcuC-like enzyme